MGPSDHPFDVEHISVLVANKVVEAFSIVLDKMNMILAKMNEMHKDVCAMEAKVVPDVESKIHHMQDAVIANILGFLAKSESNTRMQIATEANNEVNGSSMANGGGICNGAAQCGNKTRY